MSDITRSESIKQLRLLKADIINGLSFVSKTKDKHKASKSLDMAIKSLEIDEAYQLEYERTTKNDLVTLTFSKGTLKYSCKDYVVYKKDWLRSHYGAEIDIMFGDSQYKESTTKNDLAVSNGLENPTKKYCGCCKHWKRKGVKKIGDKPTSYGKCTKLSISGFEVETTYNDDCSSEGLE